MILTIITLIIAARPLQVAHQSAEKIVELDPYGIGMAFIAMSVVFSVLAMTYVIFKNISRIYDFVTNRTKKVRAKLHLYYNQQHDMESLKLTIQKVSKMYSPWSSKIYSMRQSPK